GGSHGSRIRRGQAAVDLGVTDLGALVQRQAGRIDPAVDVIVVVLEVFRTGGTDTGVRRDRDVVTAGVAEDLDSGVTLDVPREAQARRDLVVGLDPRDAVAVLALELLPAHAEICEEVVRDLPAVFQVESGVDVLVGGRAGLQEAGTRVLLARGDQFAVHRAAWLARIDAAGDRVVRDGVIRPVDATRVGLALVGRDVRLFVVAEAD